MANPQRILRSIATNTPAALTQGELANSELLSPNGINELFIGTSGATIFKLISNVGGLPATPNDSGQDNQTITTGDGIKGAEAGLDTSFTIELALEELSVTTMLGSDWIAFDDGGTSKKALISTIPLSLFNNDSGWEANDPNEVLTTDVGSASWNWIIDEDNMVSDSVAHVPTQQSVKKYVDDEIASVIAGGVTYKGAYDATANPDTTPNVGDMYTVTVGGTGVANFWSTPLAIGDVIIAETTDGTTEDNWTTIEANQDMTTFALKVTDMIAGIGLSGGGDLSTDRTFNLDIGGLTQETTVDGAADYVAMLDATGAVHRKVLLNDILDAGTF